MGAVAKPFGDLVTFTRASGGGRFNASGQFEWLANNVPRFDYDPVTLACKGLLVEGQRTNLLLQSNGFDQPSWSKTELTVMAGVATAPDGSLTACKCIPTSVVSSHPLSRASSTVVGTTYTHSIYAKAGELAYIQLAGSSGFSTAEYANFDLNSGIVSKSTSEVVTSIRNVGGGWYRCSVALNSTATSSQIAMFVINDPQAARGQSFAGDDTSGLYIWGAQLEEGSFSSSYIPTTTAQVTRAADVASVNTLSPWYRADEGTLFVEGAARLMASGASGSLVCIGTSSEYSALIQQTSSTINGTTRVNGTNPASIAVASQLGANAKAAFAFRKNDFSIAVNGVLGAPDTNGDLFNGAGATLKIGNFSNSNNFANGHIRAIRYFPKRLSDAELQQLTA